MTPAQCQLVDAWEVGELTVEALRERFPVDDLDDPNFIQREVGGAIASEDSATIDRAAILVLLSRAEPLVGPLNSLLVTPGHRKHQAIAKALQRRRDPCTVPFVAQALELGFDHLEYTCSEPEVIAKWYSWLLADIGTPEAIRLIEVYAAAHGPASSEMAYRLEKLRREH